MRAINRGIAAEIYVLAALISFYVSVFRAAWFPALLSSIVLYHAAHELMHESIFRSRSVNRFVGVLVQSCCLHNYFLLRAAHAAHHRCGREDRGHCLIDHKHTTYRMREHVYYYSYLCGLNYYVYAVAGLIYVISPSMFNKHFFFARFKGGYVPIVQCIVGLNMALLIYFLQIQFLLWLFLFGLYWGLSQNLSHYALQTGGPGAKFASRTFRVSPVWEFVFFGSIFRHLEHHVLPHVPSHKLGSRYVAGHVRKVIEGEPLVSYGIRAYWWAMIQQFRGPQPEIEAWKL